MNRLLFAYCIVGILLGGARTVAGCSSLSPADTAKVASDGIQISTCAAEARLCGKADGGPRACWDEYDACIAGHGFRDGGK